MWGELRQRTSTLIWDRTERGEEREILQRKSDELHSPTSLQEDSTQDDEEAKNDFWTIARDFIYRYTWNPESNCASKYINVTRTTHTSLDVLLENEIEDYWNVYGEKELSDAWTDFTRFILLNGRPPDGCTWSGRSLTRKQTNTRPDNV